LAESLSNLVKNHNITLAVFGLGNVGGPIAAAWLRAGAKVIGVDISKKLLGEIKNGISHKKEPFLSETFLQSFKDGTFSVTDNGIEASKNSDIKIIAVPVGLKNKKIELESLIAATTTISKGLKKGDAVVVCPSLPPGTTQTLVLKILEKNSKLKGENDFYLIYNPERIFEGRALQDIEENYPAIISGLGPKSLEYADELLKIISKKGTLRMSSIANAEAEKLFEGVYRDVNIALANELADYCEKIGVDYWEARKGANSQPFCHLHYPGTGVGGLCIPVYPRFIIDSSKKVGKHIKLIEYSRRINDYMPKKCVKDAITLLRNNKLKLKGSKIAVLGLGFRGEVTDTRLSPTYTVVKELLKQGFKVAVHDPFIEKDPTLPKNVTLTNDLDDATKDASLIFISSDHKMYSSLSDNSFKNAKKPLLIFDGRNILSKENFADASILTLGQRV
jgi:nucleotide sugar dehydrogenase